MRIALLGAGIIGTVVGRDLAAWDQPDEVVVGDLDEARAARVAAEAGFESAAVDVRDAESLDAFLRGADVVVNAAQYEVNLAVMEGALRAGAHYTDLGGLFFTTRKQLLLDRQFEEAGLTAVLGIGSCPGIANIHAGDLAARMDTVKSVIIYNGATVDPSDSLKWPYSLWTIFDEIVERPMVFRGGEFMDLDPLSEEELFPFKEPIGYQKAHLSLHSEVATIPLSLADKGIEACEFKIHFFGFPEGALRKLQFLASLGLASKEARSVGEVGGVVPRRLLVDLLEELQPDPPQHAGFKDIATVAVGTRDGIPIEMRLDTTAWPSEVLKVYGGTMVVGSPAAIVARWLASGRIAAKGVRPPETSIDPQPFYEDLAVRGAQTSLREERILAG
ncbi:MAG: saccharopine dehydrogenase NADP-binding domain-containing protein [Actinobacteria bacterium]|nr:saccharopine dehydrogenase NADP-binding domain-containing protein [Actinomycetota bacterium]MBU1493503.1 saccharopine dehydrogenase NADP-binding domain-containing protein [Actinomycetota bacterium]MBU1865566.1 saccharopine dehydrogenase NADP-binding domain-containing protein [Actinomycetota bacterium]